MNKIKNINLIIKPNETSEEVIRKVCINAGVSCDEPFIFSAIMMLVDDGTHVLKINHIDTTTKADKTDCNIYTIENVIADLLERAKTCDIVYTLPPLEQWLILYKPLLLSMVNKVHESYKIEKDELLQIVYMVICSLYSKGYYLHNNLIYTSFINELNMQYRNENRLSVVSLDTVVNSDSEDRDMSLIDFVEDTSYDEYAEVCAKQDRFSALKELMLKDMSELQYDRILIQLKSRTVDRRTSYLLDKYRQQFNSTYVPRPNGRS